MRLPDFLTRTGTYAAWLAFAVATYVATWFVDPYVFGFAVLGVGSVSGAVAVSGLVAAIRRDGSASRRGVGWLALLIAAASIAAFVAARTIRWA